MQLDYHWQFTGLDKAKSEQRESAPERPAIPAGRPVSRPSYSTGDSVEQAKVQESPLPPRPSSSMGGRSSSALALAYEAGSVVSEGGSDVFPFVIEPEAGSIPAGKKASFSVKFSPLDVSEYEALLMFR